MKIKELSKAEFMQVCKDHFDKSKYKDKMAVYPTVYNTDMREYYEKRRDIWEHIKENPDSVEFNRTLHLLSNYNFDNSANFDSDDQLEYFDLHQYTDYCEEGSKLNKEFIAWSEGNGKLTPMDFIKLCKLDDTYFETIIKEKDNISELENNEILKTFFGISDMNEADPIEDLAYWTVYFVPCTDDWELAYKCKLTPFVYEGEFMLALSGCGMDLSPKLDAYQALKSGYIPDDSQLLKDEKYFRYVVGNDITDEVIWKCKIEPEFTIAMKIKDKVKEVV